MASKALQETKGTDGADGKSETKIAESPVPSFDAVTLSDKIHATCKAAYDIATAARALDRAIAHVPPNLDVATVAAVAVAAFKAKDAVNDCTAIANGVSRDPDYTLAAEILVAVTASLESAISLVNSNAASAAAAVVIAVAHANAAVAITTAADIRDVVAAGIVNNDDLKKAAIGAAKAVSAEAKTLYDALYASGAIAATAPRAIAASSVIAGAASSLQYALKIYLNLDIVVDAAASDALAATVPAEMAAASAGLEKKVDAAMGNTLKMLRYLVDAAHDAASGAKAAALALNFVLADALSQAAGDA